MSLVEYMSWLLVQVMVVQCCASPYPPQLSRFIDPGSCFVCFKCEDNSSLKSVFVEPSVGILKCMLKNHNVKL